MTTREITEALDRWRAADRRWGATALGDPEYQDAVTDVITAWLGYQEAADERPGSVMLVVDNDLRYVAVSAGVRDALG